MPVNYLPGAWAHECWRRHVLPGLLKWDNRKSFPWEKKDFLDDKFPNKARDLFTGIEDLCREKGWLVLGYIRDAPLYASVEMFEFSPYQYLDNSLIGCYDSAVRANNPEYLWQSQIHSLVDRASRLIPRRYHTVNDMLLDIQQPFAAWFRVLYPRDLDKRLLDMYGNEAREEISDDLVLKDFLIQIYPLTDITRLGMSL